MKLALLIALSLAAAPALAEVYKGSKFKLTITKQPDGQRVVEGEVWDTTRSEHTLLIHTQPAVTPSATDTVKVNPDSGKLEFK